MAKNLRTRLAADDSLIVYDANPKATQKFYQENGESSSRDKGVVVAKTAREVAERSVSTVLFNYMRFQMLACVCPICLF